jgi:hypothetical protein
MPFSHKIVAVVPNLYILIQIVIVVLVSLALEMLICTSGIYSKLMAVMRMILTV